MPLAKRILKFMVRDRENATDISRKRHLVSHKLNYILKKSGNYIRKTAEIDDKQLIRYKQALTVIDKIEKDVNILNEYMNAIDRQFELHEQLLRQNNTFSAEHFTDPRSKAKFVLEHEQLNAQAHNVEAKLALMNRQLEVLMKRITAELLFVEKTVEQAKENEDAQSKIFDNIDKWIHGIRALVRKVSNYHVPDLGPTPAATSSPYSRKRLDKARAESGIV